MERLCFERKIKRVAYNAFHAKPFIYSEIFVIIYPEVLIFINNCWQKQLERRYSNEKSECVFVDSSGHMFHSVRLFRQQQSKPNVSNPDNARVLDVQ